MYFNKEIFKKYNLNNTDIVFPKYDFINESINQMRKEIDEVYYNFLTEHGYRVDKPYNIKQLEEIKKDLVKQDKFLDMFYYSEVNNYSVTNHYILFFNRINNPLSEEDKQKIIDKWRKENEI